MPINPTWKAIFPRVGARRRDYAVAVAYGGSKDISTDDALAKLLALNLERAEKGR